ncbi:hypothetical protein A3A93_00595 [Candidatus Roizmanbacteria bacterium RIFCSPLOWO2_01_FULL_38_12]|uniref:Uncharacterized protein n=1 Tax=Candidatus Roizmanbacteria bacterium RIFCSPLOWO2_01_FULL_38_12 TaxID=1802061 RepID=A0A1F7J062_9BACT|nr:MAG: hypothetical protein A2861_00030 [Candidatus Roizmanbacteria bacterium RIFCSPHIGHO2_01_FULL_38_15]OGK36084.1 MAG: hypothetical protein A3F59_01270 [Candidatus Roizmanbacteria bacterium RIFCSPHIGHO2_12_FULL_38_13]OGK48996.1 MAG: hypothetical protein A3A93_00595 [Candidatus Roizmanbacteria bacterium RIFCSPLOWO2_01_FULL_38_12]
MTNIKKSIYLYDVAGAIIATFFLAPLVSVAWNAIVVFILLYLFKKIKTTQYIWGVILISIGGAILDFMTYILPINFFLEYLNNKHFNDYFAANPNGTLPDMVYPSNFGLYFMILPIVSIGFFNYYMGRGYFKLNKKQSMIFALTMGLITAPWILYLYSYGPNYK